VNVTTGSGTTQLAGFKFISPPTIRTFTPNTGSSGTVITIYGMNFIGTTNVRFGGTDATFIVNSDSVITATVGSGSTGSITVISAGGTASASGFRYLPAPSAPNIYSFTPDSGSTGNTIFIFGSFFTGATTVQFGGVNAKSFAVTSDST